MEKASPCYSVAFTVEGQLGVLNFGGKNPSHWVRKITTDLHPPKQKGFQPPPSSEILSSLWASGEQGLTLSSWLEKAISRYSDGCTHYCRNHFKYLRRVAPYAPKLAYSLYCQFSFLFPWVTLTGQGWCGERSRVHFGLPVQQGHSPQTYLTRNASHTGGSHSAVWWCSAPDRNLLWRSLHTDFLALVPNQISRSSKSEGQVPSQPSKTRRVPPCWQARGETENVVQ